MTYIYSSFYCAVCSSDTAGKKTRFQDIKVYFCLKNAKKMERGQKLKEVKKKLSNLKGLCPFIKVVEVTNTSTDLAVYYGSMFYEWKYCNKQLFSLL